MRFKSDEELLGKLSAELDHLDMLYADVTPPSLPELEHLIAGKLSDGGSGAVRNCCYSF